jgi:tetratricopeptide (TPR) repeat protein
MPRRTPEDIRAVFANSADFNQLFDAFEEALAQELRDIELYRILFWNNSLSPDELRMFGEKLSREFPELAYETFLWLANVFEVTYSAYDNFELAMVYYRKAASVNPEDPDPYIRACDCYDPDLNIPPIPLLIDFLKAGLQTVKNKQVLYLRLSHLYQLKGDEDLSEFFRRLAGQSGSGNGGSGNGDSGNGGPAGEHP